MEEQKMERDFEQEVRELYEEHPDLRGGALPEAVITACVGGTNLKEAYAAYSEEKKEAEKPAPKAPVSGVTRGGSVSSKPEDAFLRGFNSTW